MLKLKFGFTVVLSTILPTNYLYQLSSGGMYGSLFREFPPAIYLSLGLIANLVVAWLVWSFFTNKADLPNRLPSAIPGTSLVLIGGIFVLLPQVLRIYTSTIQGGGASYALLSYTAPITTAARLALFVGAAKVLLAVKPHESYVYQDFEEPVV